MDEDGSTDPVAALRRRLRALEALAADPRATPAERARAAALKQPIEQRLRGARAPARGWSGTGFRLGGRLKQIGQPAPPAVAEADGPEHARRLGKAVRHGYKKWLSN